MDQFELITQILITLRKQGGNKSIISQETYNNIIRLADGFIYDQETILKR